MSNTTVGKLYERLEMASNDRFHGFSVTNMAQTLEKYGLRDGALLTIFREPKRSAGFDTREREMTVQVENIHRQGSVSLKVSPEDTCDDVLFLLMDAKTVGTNKYTLRFKLPAEFEVTGGPNAKGLASISTLSSCGIKEGGLFCLPTSAKSIVGKTLTGKSLLLVMEPDYTIE